MKCNTAEIVHFTVSVSHIDIHSTMSTKYKFSWVRGTHVAFLFTEMFVRVLREALPLVMPFIWLLLLLNHILHNNQIPGELSKRIVF